MFKNEYSPVFQNALMQATYQSGLDAAATVLHLGGGFSKFALPSAEPSMRWAVPVVEAAIDNPVWDQIAKLEIMPITHSDGLVTTVVLFPLETNINGLIHALVSANDTKAQWYVFDSSLINGSYENTYELLTTNFDPVTALFVATGEDDVSSLCNDDHSYALYEKFLNEYKLSNEYEPPSENEEFIHSIASIESFDFEPIIRIRDELKEIRNELKEMLDDDKFASSTEKNLSNESRLTDIDNPFAFESIVQTMEQAKIALNIDEDSLPDVVKIVMVSSLAQDARLDELVELLSDFAVKKDSNDEIEEDVPVDPVIYDTDSIQGELFSIDDVIGTVEFIDDEE